jgi:hypothetical protein
MKQLIILFLPTTMLFPEKQVGMMLIKLKIKLEMLFLRRRRRETDYFIYMFGKSSDLPFRLQQ